jgi:hypothetical protein
MIYVRILFAALFFWIALMVYRRKSNLPVPPDHLNPWLPRARWLAIVGIVVAGVMTLLDAPAARLMRLIAIGLYGVYQVVIMMSWGRAEESPSPRSE